MEMSRVLIGKDRICDHLEVNKNIFYELVREGAPIVKDGSRWLSHADLLDEWFRSKIVQALKASKRKIA
ncbi:MAG: hypothetical protein WC241_04080 [Candidatus Paceibacterota bacterium]|jgi:hypothetical protein